MNDNPEWKGGRIGPYQVGERYQDVPEDEGRIHAAHHAGTGEPALVVMPAPDEDWRTSTPWSVRITNAIRPNSLVMHPEGKAPTLRELALGLIRMAAAVAIAAELEDARALFSRGISLSRPRPRAMRWGFAGAGLALAAGLTLLLWPRATEHPETRGAPVESIFFSDGQDLSLPAIAYPMPETPFKEQRKPPCMPDAEVEIRGGCWTPHARTAPCPRGTAEYQGKCYVPVRKPDPLPRAVQP